MTDIADLERRVIALEAAQHDNSKTLNWVVGTLGRVAADVSNLRQETKEEFDKVKADIGAVKVEVTGLRNDMPTIVADAMREVLKASR